ncbi:hypothetical protein JX266_009165 [Neoarthrinium moseri]|nr:hypothetical protein JX266_009165 [Neoarthrinium moseri]
MIDEWIQSTSTYSPILRDMDMKISSQTFNGALRDNTTIWRKPPSREVDAAWDFLSAEDMQLITVSADDILLAGKDPSRSVKAPASWGFGDDAYIAQVEVFHQIHCLNELRKEMHYDYYYSSPRTELHLSHKSHCVHMLLQTLMCNADVGIVTHQWVHDDAYSDPKTRPFPDFDVVKKCRDFDRVMHWLRHGGGVENLAEKLPMDYPGGTPVINAQGYTQKQGSKV